MTDQCIHKLPHRGGKPPHMSRLLEISPEKLTAEQKTVFDQLTAGRGRILGPYKVWIHSPTVAAGIPQQ